MTDNIEQQDQVFFYNATNELINRTNNENSRLHMLIHELMNTPTIITSSNNMDASTNNVNSSNDFFSYNSLDLPLSIMSSNTISNSIISTINESMNEKSRFKKVLSEEGEKSLTKVKYDKTKINYDKCPILQIEFEPDEEITQLPCKHCFNTSAIEHWLKEEKSICPVCRYELDNVEKKCNTEPTPTDENTDDEDTDDEDTEDEDTDNMDIVEEVYNINNNYESSIFNLINSLERASNLNNRNYYNSITEDPEIQQAILMSFTN